MIRDRSGVATWRALVVSAALAALGCSIPNDDHCARLEGDATCVARDAARPFCNRCVGDNDGCVAAQVADPACAQSASGGSTGSAATGSSTSASTGLPTTGTTGSSGPGTTDTTSTTSETGTSTTSETGTTGPGPTCGDGKLDADEACDGAQLGGKKCTDFGVMFGGGTLKCFDNCTFDTSGCCKVAAQSCLMAAECCSMNCTLLMCQ